MKPVLRAEQDHQADLRSAQEEVPGRAEVSIDGCVVYPGALLARAAKETGCKGILFDTELYKPPVPIWFLHPRSRRCIPTGLAHSLKSQV